MRSQLADHFLKTRKSKGLTLSQLTQRIGYTNVSKGCNRIQKFEQQGNIHANLLRKLADALGIDDATIDALIEQDRRESLRLWDEWANQPIRPHVVIRWCPAAYTMRMVPDDIETDEQSEGFAASTAREVGRRCCLIMSRRYSIWFDKSGNIETRTEATSGNLNSPHMRLKGIQRSFLLENRESGETILRLIDWPEQPISRLIQCR